MTGAPLPRARTRSFASNTDGSTSQVFVRNARDARRNACLARRGLSEGDALLEAELPPVPRNQRSRVHWPVGH
jgi:hypothetical protein